MGARDYSSGAHSHKQGPNPESIYCIQFSHLQVSTLTAARVNGRIHQPQLLAECNKG